MTLAQAELPEPAAGQVRIRTRAAGINFFDILQIQGKYQYKPPFPFTPGAEVAGLVDAVGQGVTEFAAGDAVLALTHGNGFAEYAVADAARTFRIPPGMSFGEAAVLPIVYHTALFALQHRAALGAGEWLLVHAGASGVGMAAIQIGAALGASVIATAGSPEKLDFCRAQGAEHALSYRDASWVDRVKEITGGRGAGVIYDPVGGDIFDLSTKCIAMEGRLLVIGFASGRIPAIQVHRVLLKNISIVGVLWGNYDRAHPEYLPRAHQSLERLYAAGRIHPRISRSYPLEAIPTALRDLADRKILGKAVVVME